MRQLELFPYGLTDWPMRMILDTVDVQIGGKSPEVAMAAIREAQAKLPEGSTDPVLEIKGGPDDLHAVCRLVFRRPQTHEEYSAELRHLPRRLKVVAA